MTRKSAPNVKRKKFKKQPPPQPEVKSIDETVVETQGAWWAREDYVKRRTNWMWRLRPYVLAKCVECQTCEFAGRCLRIPTNERITGKILKDGHCPDYKTVWKKILGDGEKYDWKF